MLVSELLDDIDFKSKHVTNELIEVPSRVLPKTLKVKTKYKKRIFQNTDQAATDYKNVRDKDNRYARNRKLRSVDAEITYTQHLENEFYRCRRDVVYFAQNYVSIFNGSHDYAIQFEPRPYQIQLLRSLQSNRFNVANQSRQTGKSVTVAVFIAWLITFHAYKGVGIINKVKDDSNKNLRDVVRVLEGLPDFLSVGIVNLSVDGIELENGSYVNTHPSKPDTVNGYSYALTWMDEYALQKDGQELLESGVIPLTSSNDQSRVVITSTPRGKNHFYDVCRKAIKYSELSVEQVGNPEFKKWIIHEVHWWENPDNGYTKKFKLSLTAPYSFKLVTTYANPFAADEIDKIGLERFKQDYECSFLSSEDQLIPLDAIENYKQQLLSRSFTDPEICYGGLKMYQSGRSDTHYVVSVDPSNGGGGDSDNFALSVWAYHKGLFMQVATYAQPNVSLKTAGDLIDCLYEEYYDPLVIVETNGSGTQFINELQHEDRNPINIYKSGSRYGVTTTQKTKTPSLGLFRTAFLQQEIGILDFDLLTELEHFSSKNEKRSIFEAEKGYKDDRVMVCSILYQAVGNGDLYRQMR